MEMCNTFTLMQVDPSLFNIYVNCLRCGLDSNHTSDVIVKTLFSFCNSSKKL